MITNSTWPEFSRAIGGGDLDVARRLHRRACQIGLWLAIVGCAITAAVGPRFFVHWSLGKAPFRFDVLLPMLVVVIVNSLWTVSYVVPLSVNRHQRLTYTYLGATVPRSRRQRRAGQALWPSRRRLGPRPRGPRDGRRRAPDLDAASGGRLGLPFPHASALPLVRGQDRRPRAPGQRPDGSGGVRILFLGSKAGTARPPGRRLPPPGPRRDGGQRGHLPPREPLRA